MGIFKHGEDPVGVAIREVAIELKLSRIREAAEKKHGAMLRQRLIPMMRGATAFDADGLKVRTRLVSRSKLDEESLTRDWPEINLDAYRRPGEPSLYVAVTAADWLLEQASKVKGK